MSTRRNFLKKTSTSATILAAAPALLTTKKSAADEADFISLFDGESLEGWHINPEKIWHGTGGQWRVEEGAIVGEQDPPGSGNGGILLTDQKFGDFELLCEIRPDWGIDSGMFVRATDKGQGFQMMIDYLENGSVGYLYGEQIGGFGVRNFALQGTLDENDQLVSLKGMPTENYDDNPMTFASSPEDWIKAWHIGDWNDVRIVCVGDYPIIKIWINGNLVADFNASTFSHPNYDREEVMKTLGREGSIAVQVHGGSNRWGYRGKKSMAKHANTGVINIVCYYTHL